MYANRDRGANMKKNDIFTLLDDLEKSDDTLKKWGDLYRTEEKIIETNVQSRKEKVLSQKEVAKIANLKQPAIARIETGAHSPQLDTLLKLIDALDLKIEIKKVNCIEIGDDIFEQILDEYHQFYSRNNDEKETYVTFNKEGGFINENKSHKHPCKEYLPA
jgi:transcriptional regulator with XRE-family HTH domain